jgi:hypothetical protein
MKGKLCNKYFSWKEEAFDKKQGLGPHVAGRAKGSMWPQTKHTFVGVTQRSAASLGALGKETDTVLAQVRRFAILKAPDHRSHVHERRRGFQYLDLMQVRV